MNIRSLLQQRQQHSSDPGRLLSILYQQASDASVAKVAEQSTPRRLDDAIKTTSALMSCAEEDNQASGGVTKRWRYVCSRAKQLKALKDKGQVVAADLPFPKTTRCLPS